MVTTNAEAVAAAANAASQKQLQPSASQRSRTTEPAKTMGSSNEKKNQANESSKAKYLLVSNPNNKQSTHQNSGSSASGI